MSGGWINGLPGPAEERAGGTPVPFVAILLFAVAGAALVEAATWRWGSGVGPDSVSYIACARSLLRKEGYRDWTGNYCVSWPPLFPALLAGVAWAAGDPLEVAPHVNAALFGGIVLLSGLLLRSTIKSRFLIYAGIAIIAASPFRRTANMAWSEPLFIVCTLSSLWFLASYVRSGRTVAVFLAGSMAALAWLTRYAGFTLVPAAALVLAVRKGPSIRRRLGSIVAFTLLSALPIAAWLLRNWLSTGSPAHPWPPANRTLVQSLVNVGGTIARWSLPDRLRTILPDWVMLGVFALMFAASSGLVLLYVFSRERPFAPAVLVMASYAAIYPAAIAFSAAMLGTDSPNGRLLSPVLAPLAFLVLVGLDRLLAARGPGTRPTALRLFRLARLLSVSAVALYGAFVCFRTVKDLAECNRDGVGGYDGKWRTSSSTLGAVRNLDPAARILSNIPEGIYLGAGRRALFSPQKRFYASAEGLGDAEVKAFKSQLMDGRTTMLVWFEPNGRDYLYSLQELDAFCKRELLTATPDTEVFLLKPLP